MMTHTPGPWRFLENSVITDCPNLKMNRTHGYGCGNNFIASLNDGEYHEYSNAVEQAMNGHLIAAAPEMLEALKEAEAELVSVFKSVAAGSLVLRQIRAAIAKAEGR